MAKQKFNSPFLLKELRSDINFILKMDGKAALDLPVVVETHDEWKSYHISPGLAKRAHKGKTYIVWRLPKGMEL